ncbi:hypothetical protein ABNQ39_06965 [Azospirillum sp. A26]|uniref:hypothetical protein n=1 Tax=Azospirillum sp. A26 TaxID=3160607 RepID=UPI00366BC143
MQTFEKISWEIGEDLRQRLGGAVEAEICQKAILYLLKTPTERLEMLSLSSLNDALDRQYEREQLLRSLQILSGSWLDLLEVFFKYYDEVRDEEIDVELESVSDAEESGQFIHPATGMPIDNYRNNLFMYFGASKKLRDMKSRLHA